MNPAERREKLTKSKFRSKFKLSPEDRAYIQKTGWEKISQHARDFIQSRLAPALPKNDGKQTPYKGHPVFKAQHATATCCRGCLEKWYQIPKGKALDEPEIKRVQTVILSWILEKFHAEGVKKPA